jgi:hypothetical protein
LQSIVKTNAFNRVIAGVLSQQHINKQLYLVTYFFKTIALAKCNYGIHDKEMLTIVRSLDQWRPELKGITKKIQIFTNYKALKYFITTKQLTEQQAR